MIAAAFMRTTISIRGTGVVNQLQSGADNNGSMLCHDGCRTHLFPIPWR